MAVRNLVLVLLGLGSVIACGGSTSGDGTPATGGVGAGGSGIDTGGSTATGASGVGIGGSTANDPACRAPQDSGLCDAYFEAWWHDPELGVCVPFVYGGCGGNENNHATLDDCLARCRGGDFQVDGCEWNSDCMLHAVGCCGPCEPVQAQDFVALNSNLVDEFDQAYTCGPVLCGACEEIPPTARTQQHLYAACVDGQCAVRDVREAAMSTCSVPADCRLRCGSRCCESCSGGDDLIAVRADADVTAEFCGGAPVSCVTCDCTIPETAAADCIDGRCVVLGASACSGVGGDCNDDPAMSSIAGECNPDGSCTCYPGRTKNPSTGRCY